MEEEQTPFIDQMRQYYDKCFPYDEFYQWLSYGNDAQSAIPQNYFQRREFSFTLEGDIYSRYKSFSNPKQLKSTLIQ